MQLVISDHIQWRNSIVIVIGRKKNVYYNFSTFTLVKILKTTLLLSISGYSLIYNPWLCLVFEALESVTSSLSFTAAVTYAAKLSSTTTDTSVQGLLGGLYYGVGENHMIELLIL